MLSSNRPNKKNYEMILDAVSVLYQKRTHIAHTVLKLLQRSMMTDAVD